LAVLAATTVDPGHDNAVVAARLAPHAGARTWKRAASRLRDFVAALDAVARSLANGNAGASGEDAIGDGVVDLIEHRAFASPAGGHEIVRFFRVVRCLDRSGETDLRYVRQRGMDRAGVDKGSINSACFM
jgi:hypothetical protein